MQPYPEEIFNEVMQRTYVSVLKLCPFENRILRTLSGFG